MILAGRGGDNVTSEPESARRPPTDAPYAAPDERIGFLLNRLGHAIGRAFEAALSEHGLRGGHFGVLNGLHAYGPLHQQRLANLLGLDRQTMVNLVRDLERRGLVRRERRPEDRRALAVHLTEQGRALFHQADEASVRVEGAIFAALSEGERRELHRLLQLLVASGPFGQLFAPPDRDPPSA